MSKLKAFLRTWPGIVTATVTALILVGGTLIATGERVAAIIDAPVEIRGHHDTLVAIMPKIQYVDSVHAELHTIQRAVSLNSRLLCEIADISVRDCR